MRPASSYATTSLSPAICASMSTIPSATAWNCWSRPNRRGAPLAPWCRGPPAAPSTVHRLNALCLPHNAVEQSENILYIPWTDQRALTSEPYPVAECRLMLSFFDRRHVQPRIGTAKYAIYDSFVPPLAKSRSATLPYVPCPAEAAAKAGVRDASLGTDRRGMMAMVQAGSIDRIAPCC